MEGEKRLSEEFTPPVLRIPKGRGGVGCARAEGYPAKGLKSGGSLKRTPLSRKNRPLRKVGRTKRGREERVLRLVKKLVVQEYAEALGIPAEELRHLDLDHLLGRHGLWNGIPMILSLRNLQLLTRKVHGEKTDGVKVSSKRDFRDKRVEARLYSISERLEARYLNRPFDLWDYARAIRAEIRV